MSNPAAPSARNKINLVFCGAGEGPGVGLGVGAGVGLGVGEGLGEGADAINSQLLTLNVQLVSLIDMFSFIFFEIKTRHGMLSVFY